MYLSAGILTVEDAISGPLRAAPLSLKRKGPGPAVRVLDFSGPGLRNRRSKRARPAPGIVSSSTARKARNGFRTRFRIGRIEG